MIRFLFIQIVFLMALLSCAGDVMKVEASASEEGSVSCSGKTNSLTDTKQGRHNDVMLYDARNMIRLCNSRPQRLLPVHGSEPGKHVARSFVVRRAGGKCVFFRHDGRRRLETAPFQSAASRDYYVFALRHIIC